VKKLSEDTLPKDKEYLIAQDFILHGTHYYRVTAKTMGAAVAQIEEDNDLHPEDYEAQNVLITGYTEAEDNYDS
tara:strand:- start:454 stop:675 length:222 start_codon:yes stop_codon:yes gene_type:complete